MASISGISNANFVLRVAPDGQDAAVGRVRQSMASRINKHCDQKVDRVADRFDNHVGRIRYSVSDRISERPVDVRA